MSIESFYADLHGFEEFRSFGASDCYAPLPESWWIVITDVENSTEAIEAGRYRDVNAIGAASIIALLNAVSPIKVPYQFGGDGSTLCIPESKLDAVRSALAATKAMARESFRLELRIGMVPVRELMDRGERVLVGKHLVNKNFEQAMFMGQGMTTAEQLVKSDMPGNPWLIDEERVVAEADFDGFQCRWQEIPSPHGEVVALLIQATAGSDQERESLYAELFDRFEAIYGALDSHHPVSEMMMRLAGSLKELATEIGVRTAGTGWLRRRTYGIYLRMRTAVGGWLMKGSISSAAQWWRRYKRNFIANSDHRKFDNALRMVVSGRAEQRIRFESYLKEQNEAGRLVYGIHTSHSSLATCLVRDFNSDHVHFLDAAEGGYALAAKQLKAQLADRASG